MTACLISCFLWDELVSDGGEDVDAKERRGRAFDRGRCLCGCNVRFGTSLRIWNAIKVVLCCFLAAVDIEA